MTSSTETRVTLDASSSDLEPFQMQDMPVRLGRSRFPAGFEAETGDTLTLVLNDDEEWAGCYVTDTGPQFIQIGLA